MAVRSQPECPECEKLSAVAQKSNEIGDFMDWIIDNTEFRICENEGYEYYSSSHLQRERLIAQYFEIDLDKVEKERFELLKWLQEQHKENSNG